MTLTEHDNAVLAYYGREVTGAAEALALAGLSLGSFRAARVRLIASGRLVRDVRGRYIPVDAVTSYVREPDPPKVTDEPESEAA